MGADLFSLNCAACHTITGAGDALAFGTTRPRCTTARSRRSRSPRPSAPDPQHAPLLGQPDRRPGARHRGLRHRQLQHPANPGGFGLGGVGPVAEGFVALLFGVGVWPSSASGSGSARERRRPPARRHPGADAGRGARRPAPQRRGAGTPSAPRTSSPLIFLVAIVLVRRLRAPRAGRTGTPGSSAARSGSGSSPWASASPPGASTSCPRAPSSRSATPWPRRAEERDAMAAALVERTGVVVKRRKVLGGLLAVGCRRLRARGPLPADRARSARCPGRARQDQLEGGTLLVDSNGRPIHRDDPRRRRDHDRLPAHGASRRSGIFTDPGGHRPDGAHPGPDHPSSTTMPGRESWTPDGYVAYSKVCTHLGCPVGPLRAGARAPGLPLPPVDVQRAQRRRAPVRAGPPAAAPAAPRHRRRGLPLPRPATTSPSARASGSGPR